MTADRQPVRLPARFDTSTGLAGLLRMHGVPVEFEPARHPDLDVFDAAVTEHEAQADDVAEQVDPWMCADCDQPSTHPVVVEAPSGRSMVRYVCAAHHDARAGRAKYRIYFDATPGRRSWTLDFPANCPHRDVFGDGIACETYDEACEAFRAALLGEDALRAFLGPVWTH